MEACDGNVSGAVAYAWVNRLPRATSALNAGVSTPLASGPMASARVVSSVTSRIDVFCEAGPGADAFSPPHATVSTISSAAATAAGDSIRPWVRFRESAVNTS